MKFASWSQFLKEAGQKIVLLISLLQVSRWTSFWHKSTTQALKSDVSFASWDTGKFDLYNPPYIPHITLVIGPFQAEQERGHLNLKFQIELCSFFNWSVLSPFRIFKTGMCYIWVALQGIYVYLHHKHDIVNLCVICLNIDATLLKNLCFIYVLKVGVKGSNPIIKGELSKPVQSDETLWSLDKSVIEITLSKKDRQNWWNSIIAGQDVIDTSKVKISSVSAKLFWLAFNLLQLIHLKIRFQYSKGTK